MFDDVVVPVFWIILTPIVLNAIVFLLVAQ